MNQKNLFFPYTQDEEDEIELEEQSDDGYGPLTNGWYDIASGSHFIFFEKNSRYRK
jgi:hypothetical protein